MNKVGFSFLGINLNSGILPRQCLLIISLAGLQWQNCSVCLASQGDTPPPTPKVKCLKQIEYRCSVELNSLDDDVAVPALHELLRNQIVSADIARKLIRFQGYKRSRHMKILAARHVGQMCPDSAADEIAEELIALMATESDPMIMSGFASSLGILNCDSDSISDALIKHSESKHPNVRAECYEALGHKRAKENKVIEVLRRGVFDDEMDSLHFHVFTQPVCIRAIDALLRHKEYQPDETITILQPCLKSEDKNIVVHAANAIVRLSKTSAQRRSMSPVLRPFLKLKASEFGPALTDLANCELAVDTLRHIGDVDRETVEALLNLAVNTPDDADELCASVARNLSVVAPEAAASVLHVFRQRLNSMPEYSYDARKILCTAIQSIENHEEGQ